RGRRHGLSLPSLSLRFLRALCHALPVALLPTACLLELDASKLHPANVDASADAASASITDGAAEAQPPYLGLACNTTHCPMPGHVCCASTFGDPDYGNGACSTEDQCQTGDYFVCESPRDCDGLPACCVVRLPGGAFTKTKCASSCDANGTTL